MQGREKTADQRSKENRKKRREHLQPRVPDDSRDVPGHMSEATGDNSEGGDWLISSLFVSGD